MSVDPFSNALVHLKNCDFVSKSQCVVNPATNVLGEVLKIFKSEKYINDFKEVSEEGKKSFTISLNGNIVNCKAIKPRFPMDNKSYEDFEKKYLPARGVGILIVSTSQGIMTHIEAKKRKIGGRLLAYIY